MRVLIFIGAFALCSMSASAQAKFTPSSLASKVPSFMSMDEDEDEVSCQADVNHDGFVNIMDMLAVTAAYGTESSDRCDVDGDGFVTSKDILIVLAELGSVCDD